MKSLSEAQEMESVGAIGRCKPYPEYKDSGVEWLGEVPEHWELRRLKTTINSCVNGLWGDDPQGDIEDIICVRVADFLRDKFRVSLSDPTYRSIPKPQRTNRIIHRGDLLLEKSGGGDLQPVGAVVLYDHDDVAVNSNFITLIRVSSSNESNYLCYLHNSLYSQGINRKSIKQTTGIQNLDQSNYFDEFVAIPPLSEQLKISIFLDREIAKIDSLIAKKQRLIELLQEKRTSLISQAVTKGLNLNEPMKDSGLEWLGEIPEGWSLIKNGYLFSERDERGFPELPLLNVSIHTGVSLREFSNEHIEQMAADWATYKKASKNDIAFNKMRMWQGAVGVTPEDGLVSPDYIVAKPKDNVNPFFYEYLFRTSAYREEINRSSHGIVPDRNRLYWDQFKDMVSINPPKIVQDTIVEYLNDKTWKINALIQRIEIVIENLQEYRAALITAAVTGKIDVRDHTPSDALNDL